MYERSRSQTLVSMSLTMALALTMVGLFVFAGGLEPVHAKGGSDNTRPGCGYGDKNHVHSGAPGHPDACTKTETSTSSTTTTSTAAIAIASADVHFYSGSLSVNLSLTQTRADCGVPVDAGTCLRYSIFDEGTGEPVAVGYGMIPNSAVTFDASRIMLNTDTDTNPSFVQLFGSGGVISLTWTATSSGSPTTIGNQTTVLSTASVHGTILGYSVPEQGVTAGMLMVLG